MSYDNFSKIHPGIAPNWIFDVIFFQTVGIYVVSFISKSCMVMKEFWAWFGWNPVKSARKHDMLSSYFVINLSK